MKTALVILLVLLFPFPAFSQTADGAKSFFLYNIDDHNGYGVKSEYHVYDGQGNEICALKPGTFAQIPISPKMVIVVQSRNFSRNAFLDSLMAFPLTSGPIVITPDFYGKTFQVGRVYNFSRGSTPIFVKEVAAPVPGEYEDALNPSPSELNFRAVTKLLEDGLQRNIAKIAGRSNQLLPSQKEVLYQKFRVEPLLGVLNILPGWSLGSIFEKDYPIAWILLGVEVPSATVAVICGGYYSLAVVSSALNSGEPAISQSQARFLTTGMLVGASVFVGASVIGIVRGFIYPNEHNALLKDTLRK